MGIFSSIAISALAISGTLNNNVVQKEQKNYFDPLNFVEENIRSGNNNVNYNDFVQGLIEEGKFSNRSTITVLTHGMGGNANHWLVENSNNFLKEDYSLPFAIYQNGRIENEYGNILADPNLHIYKFTNEIAQNIVLTNLYKMEQSNENNFRFSNLISESDELPSTGHIVLLYEGQMGSADYTISNYDAYERFAESLNNVLTAFSFQNYGYLPAVNLIGHSRGGLINLLYAYNYPEVVTNLISLGTPYTGSDWVDGLINFFNNLGQPDAAAPYSDIVNPSISSLYSTYLSAISSQVNSYAIGFEQSEEFFINFINELATNQNSSEILTDLICAYTGDTFSENEITQIVNDILSLLSLVKNFEDLNYFAETLAGALSLIDFFTEAKLEALITLVEDFVSCLNDDIYRPQNDTPFLKSDICVDTNSQLGYFQNSEEQEEFPFSSRMTIRLGDEIPFQNININHAADPLSPLVAHNLETKNETAINNIITYLSAHNGFHEHIFGMNSTSLTHSKSCVCGVTLIEEEYHNMEYEYIDGTTHYYFCNHHECSYLNILPHSFEYTNLDFNLHNKECIDCGYSTNESHLLNVYIADDLHTHTVYCSCGLPGATYEHSVSPFTGKCTYCGIPITAPDFPPINPPIGPNPIF